ncbi:MAG: SDR family oxidoreductase [Chitinophagaceae bacterium]
MRLTNNTILITGGTSGFGLEFAKRFLTLGNTVIITGRNQAKLNEIKTLLPGIHAFRSDVAKAEDIRALYHQVLNQFPGLNMLINNAGEMRKISLHHNHELTDITREIDINLTGPVRMVQQFLPHLKTKANAAIVNVTSGIALMAFPIAPIYSASKSGLRAYTQTLRIQLKHTNVKVMELVAPGSNTPLNHKFTEDRSVNESMLMTPEKIVEAAIDGMKRDRHTVYPGLSKLIRVLSRVAPGFLLKQAGKAGADYFTEQ